ncbi:hypothetical protein PRABACTJOHN_01039 [Parabacteroides johnsonii DSM 18315]|uniref:Uncharacterized protein n=1 Tax=Parabacteroides johnsonii DSM 18315 TaxID=537006 RepID=B7B7P2_9BACT|nr:hypothetical protein PRABACTJOHN_01039 [Parabacteroides johnsonii DSM 18315]
MHGDDRAAVMAGTVLQFLFQETEIGNRVGVVVFDRIGVKANEFDVPDDKGKVFSPKQFIENLVAIADYVMVTDQSDIRDIELRQDIDGPLVFFLHTELGIVSSMYDEIDTVFFCIDMFYEIFRLVVATLGVAHQDEADRVFIFCCCLDKRDVVAVDIAFGNGEPAVIRMVIDQVACRQEYAQE